MGTTQQLGLPFPEATDQPYVHLDIKALAEKVAEVIVARTRIASGTATSPTSVPPSSWVDVAVNFPVGLFDRPPALAASATSSRFTIGILAISANSATLRCANWSPAAAELGTLRWIAHQGV